MLGFWDSENVRGIPNENFPIVIIVTSRKFSISHILIDDDNSCDTMNSELFDKMSMNRSNLTSYEGSDLQAFNETTTRPWGYIELIVSSCIGEDI